MDIFEQMCCAHVMLVNGVVTTNFGHDPDEDEEFWCFSIYGVDPETKNNFEYYFGADDMKSAKRRGNQWFIHNHDEAGSVTKLEFCALIPIEDYNP